MSVPTSDSDLLARLGRALAPSYEIESELGRGGMAIVYRGRDTRLKRGVAVKLLPPELAFRTDIRTRFLREAEMSARLSHPNIVPIYTVDERDGLVFFVMALVLGGSVGDRLKVSGAMPIAEARRILREVADALGYAHRNGVVHRDIKPDNVLLDAESGRAMVTDFGIARAASEEGASRLTATGAAIGTPAYMSPEQCAGDREIDGRSDLYSLGAVAYQMIAGEPPFIGGNTPSMMMRQVMERPVPLGQRRAGVPEDLERIIMRLLEKDPGNRFASGADLVDALDGDPFTPVLAPPAGPAVHSVEIGVIAGKRRLVTNTLAGDALTIAQNRIAAKLGDLSDRDVARQARRDARDLRRGKGGKKEPKPLAERVRGFRKQFVSFAGTSAMLAGINAMTGTGFWWCVFPIMGIGLGVVTQMGSLWADGVPLGRMFVGTLPEAPAQLDPADTLAMLPASAAAAASLAATGMSDELLAGAHGSVLRQAMSDRRTVQDLISRLSETERKMLPDVKGTADALFERIVTLATALHRLDRQVGADRTPALDERIAQIEQQSGASADRERRLSLLKRQRDMLAELVRSRATLLEQYESAGLLLQNLALDLLKIRSSGLDSALGGITSATQEARALSREIGYVLDAADELRDLERKDNAPRSS